ncbi:hypothetical protein [Paraburkholderia sp. BL18I3N2]|uniref:hypothetical protein n=1 Tax=Paraburkholderia sp. BL18I3N2 TaxID=1938799 RepID=UPI0015E7B348|nr:hypothetical protein [Paraburkholderia sp. BL18I3N2]
MSAALVRNALDCLIVGACARSAKAIFFCQGMSWVCLLTFVAVHKQTHERRCDIAQLA